MNPLSIQSRIKSLETQLSVLKAQLTGLPLTGGEAVSFAQSYGLLAEAGFSTDEEIEATKRDLNGIEESCELSP